MRRKIMKKKTGEWKGKEEKMKGGGKEMRRKKNG